MKPILTLTMSIIFLNAFSQQAPEEALIQYSQKLPPEKVLLTLTRNSFIAGETIFFTAYVLSGYQPTVKATNLYTELYDKQKNLLDKGIIPLFNGSGQGSFVLPATLSEDVYYIRAYTRYMLNFNAAFNFIKAVQVYNPSSATVLKHKTPDWQLMLAPEGGSFLPGHAAKLAVRLGSNTTLPESWQGELYEQGNNQPLTELKVYNNEIGAVIFTPEAGKNYIVKAKDNTGISKEAIVPVIKDEGALLMLSVTDTKMAYQVITKNLPNKGAGYKMVATFYNEAVFSGTIKNSNGTVTGIVDIKSLPSGVIKFTLFSPQNEALNEGLCFIHPAIKQTTPKVSFDTMSFASKAFNRWNLTADSTIASYTVQVCAAESFCETDFLAQLYLTSDFTRPIHQANWYVTDVTPEKKAALDALLITENWNRFSWTEVMQPMTAPPYQPENYLSYTGVVRKGKALQPLREINLILQQQADSLNQFIQTTTDSTGSFTITEAIFSDTVRVFYQATNRKFLEKDISISLDMENRFYSYTGTWPGSAFETVARKPADVVPDEVKNAIAQRNSEKSLADKTEMLEEILIKTKGKNVKQALDEKYSSPLFSGGNSTVFDFVNENQSGALGYSNILQWLRGRVSGLTVNTVNGRTQVQIRGNRSLLGNSFAQIYVDEMPVDADYLNGFPVANIAMIKVIKSSNPLSGANGAVLIYTKRGGEGSASQTASLASNTIVGYKKQPVFFWPDYSISSFRDAIDKRPVLYWAAGVGSGENEGRQAIRFYNNDAAKKYVLLITGFDMNGQPVYLNKILQ